jgi:hypothetical protein
MMKASAIRLCASSILLGGIALGGCPLQAQSPPTQRPAAAEQPATRPIAAQPDPAAAKRIPSAEDRFQALLAEQPGNPDALAGMGSVRLQQRNFLGAISYLEPAQQTQPQDRALSAKLDAARFLFFISEGHHSLVSNELTAAEKRYISALELRPNSRAAYLGLRTTLLKARRLREEAPPVFAPAAAAPMLAQKPSSPPPATHAPTGAQQAAAQPARDTTLTGRSVPSPAPAHGLPAPQAEAQTAFPRPRPAAPVAEDTTLAGNIVAAPPAEEKEPIQPPAEQTAAAAPQPAVAAPQPAVAPPQPPVPPASDAAPKEEVYGPFVPYVRPTPPQTKLAAAPSAGH